MLNLFVTAVMFIASMGFISFSYSYNGVRRTVLGFGKAIPENCVIAGYEDGGKPYFDAVSFAERTVTYFQERMYEYVSDYDLKIGFYNHLSGIETVDNLCDEVDIFIKADFAYGVSFKKSIAFYIGEGYVE